MRILDFAAPVALVILITAYWVWALAGAAHLGSSAGLQPGGRASEHARGARRYREIAAR